MEHLKSLLVAQPSCVSLVHIFAELAEQVAIISQILRSCGRRATLSSYSERATIVVVPFCFVLVCRALLAPESADDALLVCLQFLLVCGIVCPSTVFVLLFVLILAVERAAF